MEDIRRPKAAVTLSTPYWVEAERDHFVKRMERMQVANESHGMNRGTRWLPPGEMKWALYK